MSNDKLSLFTRRVIQKCEHALEEELNFSQIWLASKLASIVIGVMLVLGFADLT